MQGFVAITACCGIRDLLLCTCRMEYTLEVMREGSILGSRSVAEKDHYTFGRTPENGAFCSFLLITRAQVIPSTGCINLIPASHCYFDDSSCQSVHWESEF